MRHQLKIAMCFLLLLPCTAFACLFSYCIGDSFQQSDLNIFNTTSQGVLVTDAAEPDLPYHGLIEKYTPHFRGAFPEDFYVVRFSPVPFTNPAGQTFSHTLEFHSAVDDKLICTVTTKAIVTLGATSVHQELSSTDETRCKTSRHWGQLFQIYYEAGNADVLIKDVG